MTTALPDAPRFRKFLPLRLGSKFKMSPTPRLLFQISVRALVLLAYPPSLVFRGPYVIFRTKASAWFCYEHRDCFRWAGLGQASRIPS